MRLLTLTDSLLSRRCPLPSPRHPTMIIRVASVCECKGRARAFVRIRDTAWMVENQFRLVSTRKRAPDQWDSQFPTIIGKKRVDFDFVFFFSSSFHFRSERASLCNIRWYLCMNGICLRCSVSLPPYCVTLLRRLLRLRRNDGSGKHAIWFVSIMVSIGTGPLCSVPS